MVLVCKKKQSEQEISQLIYEVIIDGYGFLLRPKDLLTLSNPVHRDVHNSLVV
jgi:hypothetical protein